MEENATLSQFASFIREEHLDEFVRIELKYLKDFDLPLLKKLDFLGEEVLFNLTVESLRDFLKSIEENRFVAHIKNSLKDWKDNTLPLNLDQSSITLPDIIQGYTAQRMALVSLLPEFTADIHVATSIILSLEAQYRIAEEHALSVLESIQQEQQDKAEENEEKYKDLFDNASDLIHMLSPEGLILYVNKAWERTLGYTETELKGTLIYNYVVEEDREMYRSFRQQVIGGKHSGAFITVHFITKDGGSIITEGSVTCKYRNGQPVYTRCMMHDITRRIEVEEEIRRSNILLKEQRDYVDQLIREAPDAVIVIDEQSNIVLWNPKAASIFGYAEADVIGKPLTDTIIPEQFHEAHLNGMKRYLATGASGILNKTIELPARHSDGHEIPISITISEFRQGKSGRFVAFLRDITDQRRMIRQMEQQRAELERSNKDLEQYAWLASHDLKEPARKIAVFSDTLLRKYAATLPDDASSLVKRINQNTVRMMHLIDAILSYANVSASVNARTRVELSAILSDVTNVLEMSIAEKKATVTTNGQLPVIAGIPVQMKQLFQNLLANALKYSSPSRKPEIIISSTVKDDQNLITIADNGIGFEQQYSEKIFQIFQRLESAKSEQGTGIGLALCRKIAENHGGRIEASSVPGEGSEFRIWLPLLT